jgi:teichuronic acid biosynthesis glycosyltransferase TuaC
MKILVLTKRQYMGKDLLDDRFGRFREFPLELSRLGHTVEGIAFSYRNRAEGSFVDPPSPGDPSITWHSMNLLNGFRPGIGKYLRRTRRIVQESRPDIIWSCSDAYHAIFGYRLAKEFQTKCVIDLYDNFEAFTASKIPGVVTLFKKAVQKADGVTCFSARLADYIIRTYPRSLPTAVIENGVRTDLFHDRDRADCRKALGLPENAKIIGTAGALDRSRGIETLFRAFEMLAAEDDQIHLALAGPRKRSLRIPNNSRVHDFKTLAQVEVACFINALNLAVVCYRDSAQGRYSFPQKAYEILACGVPMVAAAVGSMNDLLVKYPECLFEPENAYSCAEAICLQLKKPTVIDLDVPSWSDLAKRLEAFFLGILKAEK